MNKQVSQFSATMIGGQANSANSELVKQQFRDEAKEVSRHLQGVHHCRKLGFMQVDYADTVQRLSKLQENVPVSMVIPKQPESTKPISHNNVKDSKTEKDFANSMREAINNERFINERKRLHNRETGRIATVNEILKGGGAPVKDYIFPQKAKHDQILAMTGTLMSSNPHHIPAAVPRNKKWLGDGVGWES